VSNTSDASALITAADGYLNTINSNRATLGAVQNRFEAVVRNGQNVAENLSASRSRIMDADFAQETANLTRSQILQQAGIAMLSQANSVPQNVLSLLG
jgi:flagellin